MAETFNSFFSSIVDNLKTAYDITKKANVLAHAQLVTEGIKHSNMKEVF